MVTLLPLVAFDRETHSLPFFFLMVSTVLSRLITRAELHNLIKGVKLNLAAPSIMHLFFANDVLLFSRAHNQDTTHINLCFETYMSWSGQSLN